MSKTRRLTQAEKRLLRYPPTPDTWVCERKSNVYLMHEQRVVAETCGRINSGKNNVCTFCRKTKPTRPKKLWPAYLAACEKAGIEPGERWRDPSDAVELAAAYRQRQKAGDGRRKGS